MGTAATSHPAHFSAQAVEQANPHGMEIAKAQRIAEDGFWSAIGNTPLIKMNALSKQTGCTILGKAEFQNPGGSVKDRAAKFLVQDAEEKGLLKPGGTVVEGTAGNTGIGLAHVCRNKGYKMVIYMPNTQSQGKIDLLRLLGAEVYPVPAVPYDNPDNYNHQAQRHAERLDNAIWTNQFDNTANRQAHIPDEKSIEMVYRCLDEEGLYLGASSCLNVAAARDLAEKMGPGHTIVTILCDGAYRYAERLFSRKWLESKGLVNAIPEHLH